MKSLSLSKPHLVAMVGIPGSGKTFFAEKFAETFRAPLVSREKLARTLSQEDAVIDQVLYDQLSELTKTQQSVIVDGLADSRNTRAELAKIARQSKYTILLVWVQTDPTTAKSRALHQPAAGETRRALTNDEYDSRAKKFAPPASIEKPVVISGKHTYATQAKVVLKKLTEPRAAISIHTTPPVRPTEQRPEPTQGQPSRRNSITIR